MEMDRDCYDIWNEYKELGLVQKRMKDGTWKIKSEEQSLQGRWSEDG